MSHKYLWKVSATVLCDGIATFLHVACKYRGASPQTGMKRLYISGFSKLETFWFKEQHLISTPIYLSTNLKYTSNLMYVFYSTHKYFILYSVWPLMDANCTLLGYWWHHSICYTVLFTTPRVVITISPYNEFWPSDNLPRSGPLMSSPWMLAAYSLADGS
jgi:hypothetical protein